MGHSLKPFRLLLFDLDGTVYLGDRLLPGAAMLLTKLAAAGFTYAFLTNNSSIGPDDYRRKLRRLGLEVPRRSIITSAEASILMLQHHNIRPDRVFVLGTERLKRYLARYGISQPRTNAQAVLVGFDTELTYEKLDHACRLVRRGATLFATHPDINCPMPQGPIPDAGSLLAAIRASTGIGPKDVAGKPNRWVIKLAERNFGVKRSEMLMIGDRLNTDIRMAKRFGLGSVLVAGSNGPISGRYTPDLVVGSLAELVRHPWFSCVRQ